MTVAVAPGGQVWTPSGGGTWELGGGGGGNKPSAPLSPIVLGDSYTKVKGSAIVIFGAPSSDGGSPIQYYTATIISGPGAGATQQSVGLFTAINACSCHCRFLNLAAGIYTFSVTATNTNGTGPASVVTASATIGTLLSQYYICNGNGENADWGSFGSGGYNYADTAQVYNGESSSLSLTTGNYVIPAWTEPVTNVSGASGALNISQYNNLVLKVYISGAYPTHGINTYFRFHANIYGVCTVGSTTGVVYDANQQGSGSGWVSGEMVAYGPLGLPAGLNDVDKSAIGYTCTANTADTVSTATGVAFAVGDHYQWAGADYGNTSTIYMDSYVSGGWVTGTWNTVVIPLSVFNLAAHTQAGCDVGTIQEVVLDNNCGFTIYATDFGFST